MGIEKVGKWEAEAKGRAKGIVKGQNGDRWRKELMRCRGRGEALMGRGRKVAGP